MNAQSETFEEEYEEYDEFDEDDDGERGLSGLVVLLMGVVMLGAFASVVWIAYQQGIKTGGAGGTGTPYVAADPEPLKIEDPAAASGVEGGDRPVYDRVASGLSDPVETVAAGPEEPVTRNVDDPIAAIAGSQNAAAEVVDDAVADRIASLAMADESAAAQTPPAATKPAPAIEKPLETPAPPPSATKPPASSPPAATKPTNASAGAALSGSHLVQVGAFRSQEEASAVWARLQGKLGDYLTSKSQDVEVADLGERGVFYRLRIGPFASSDDAQTYCAGLKTRGQDCLAKAK